MEASQALQFTTESGTYKRRHLDLGISGSLPLVVTCGNSHQYMSSVNWDENFCWAFHQNSDGPFQSPHGLLYPGQRNLVIAIKRHSVLTEFSNLNLYNTFKMQIPSFPRFLNQIASSISYLNRGSRSEGS